MKTDIELNSELISLDANSNRQLNKLPFDPELSPGAKNAVRVCLRVEPSEKVTVITDEISLEIAAALVHELETVGCPYRSWVLEDVAQRPLTGFPQPIADDLATSQVSIFAVSVTSSPLMELASDARGQIWATTFANSLLLQFDPASQQFTAYSAPGSNSGTGSLYGLLIASDGDVWVAATAANLLARLDVQGKRFFFYAIPTASSLPMGLAEDNHHAIWFTEAGGDKIGVLQPK